MKYLTFLLIFLSLSSKADENPFEKFSTSKNITNKAVITWETTDNADKTCNEVSKKYGNGGFSYKVEACAFWFNDKNHTCRTITDKNTTMATLGHEIRHCFQGEFH